MHIVSLIALFLSLQSIGRIGAYREMSENKLSSGFPDTLKGFGYAFNAVGQLRRIDEKTGLSTEQSFQFDVSSNANYNQQHYEALGEAITEHVYGLLTEIGLKKIHVPISSLPETEASFVFGTKTDFSNTKKLLILIHGSGVVRAGQWSRSLIINHSLDHGTQIPYIKRATELGYEVLITNTNHNYRIGDNGQRVPFAGNESPKSHATLVWDQLIAPSLDSIQSFAIVAHSYGGVITLDLANKYQHAFLNKCFAVGFTDSVHSSNVLNDKLINHFQKIARNWVTSSRQLDTPVDTTSKDIPRYSAGHTKHE